MKFLSVIFMGAVFLAGANRDLFAGGCSGGSCSPLTKKQYKAIKTSQNDAKRQAWMKQRESYWKSVYAKNTAMQAQQAGNRRR